jgi:uncharacterized membrane protein
MNRKNISRVVLSVFFTFAGINHFINPAFYYPLIPDYFSYPELINFVSGVLEISFGIGVMIPAFRKYALIGILCLLVVFIPSHVFFIQKGSCIPDGLCVPSFVGWLRLLAIHPLLIFWVYSVYRN